MILYLLCPGLILGIVASQAANITMEGLDEAERQTLNSGMKLRNVTSSFSENTTKLNVELLINRTSVITEDNEHFQENENKFAGHQCKHKLMRTYIRACGDDFRKNMEILGTDNWCVLEHVIRPYNELTLCVEFETDMAECFFPNPEVQDFFIDIHSSYFQNCTSKELQPEDAPHGVVISLTLLSVIFIPFLVYLVAWKSSAA